MTIVHPLQVITKDSNVLVVALAGNILTGLAKGLRKKYSPYASVFLAAIFEKFKEKKLNVVTSLREASDSIFVTVRERERQRDRETERQRETERERETERDRERQREREEEREGGGRRRRVQCACERDFNVMY